MKIAAAIPTLVEITTAGSHASCTDRSNASNGTGMSRPARRTTIESAPSPTNANCPSESCPAQPASGVIDIATSA